jgi:hypothetical protein
VTESTELLQRARSTRAAGSAVPATASTSTVPDRTEQLERLAIDSLQASAEAIRSSTGRQVVLDLSTGGLADNRSQSGPSASVSTEISPVPAIPGSNTQQESQEPPARPAPVEDIGVRMSDLDLTNRAPVRAGRKAQGGR